MMVQLSLALSTNCFDNCPQTSDILHTSLSKNHIFLARGHTYYPPYAFSSCKSHILWSYYQKPSLAYTHNDYPCNSSDNCIDPSPIFLIDSLSSNSNLPSSWFYPYCLQTHSKHWIWPVQVTYYSDYRYSLHFQSVFGYSDSNWWHFRDTIH